MCFMEGFAWLSSYLLLYITLSHFQGGRGSVGSEEAQTSNSRSCSGGVGCDFIFTLKELIFCRCIQTSHSGNRTKSWEKGEVSAVVPSGLGAHFVHWCPHRELMSSFGKHCLLLCPM